MLALVGGFTGLAFTTGLPVLAVIGGVLLGVLVGVGLSAANVAQRRRGLARRTGWTGDAEELRRVVDLVERGQIPDEPGVHRELAYRYALDSKNEARSGDAAQGLIMTVLVATFGLGQDSTLVTVAGVAVAAFAIGWIVVHAWIVPRRYQAVLRQIEATTAPP